MKLIWLGVGFLNKTGAEIGFDFIKSAKKTFFIIEKMKKYRKCPALHKWANVIFEQMSPRHDSPFCRKKFFLQSFFFCDSRGGREICSANICLHAIKAVCTAVAY